MNMGNTHFNQQLICGREVLSQASMERFGDCILVKMLTLSLNYDTWQNANSTRLYINQDNLKIDLLGSCIADMLNKLCSLIS